MRRKAIIKTVESITTIKIEVLIESTTGEIKRISLDDIITTYEIDMINKSGHIVYREYMNNANKAQAENAAKAIKTGFNGLYNDCTAKVYRIK
jgi:hypothetical protein